MLGSTSRCVALGAFLGMACMETPALPQEPSLSVTFSPGAGLAPLPATRIAIRVSGPRLDPAELWLFEGALGDSKLARLGDEALPKTLTELSRPVLAWPSAAPGETLLQPLVWLTVGAPYTLAAPGFGPLATFVVDGPADLRALTRAWPPRGFRAGGRLVVCGAPLEAGPIELSPSAVPATIRPAVGAIDDQACSLVVFDAAAAEHGLVALPPEIDGHLIEPGSFEVGPREHAPAFPVCAADELELGPGCVRVEDDRLVVRSVDQPLLWRFEPFVAGEAARLVPAAANAEFAVRGLTPASTVGIRGSVLSTDGEEALFSAEVTTSAPRTRLVVNEVLANPTGPEPASEWVELYNSGISAASLAGMRLRDSAGSVELPDVTLEAGAFALVVREDFSPSSTDVAPASSVRRVAVPQLGKNGLANSGEGIALLDAEGAVLSAFPALAAAHAGVSVARREPDAPDSDLAAFGEHAAPGASPGAPNVLAARD